MAGYALPCQHLLLEKFDIAGVTFYKCTNCKEKFEVPRSAELIIDTPVQAVDEPKEPEV